MNPSLTPARAARKPPPPPRRRRLRRLRRCAWLRRRPGAGSRPGPPGRSRPGPGGCGPRPRRARGRCHRRRRRRRSRAGPRPRGAAARRRGVPAGAARALAQRVGSEHRPRLTDPSLRDDVVAGVDRRQHTKTARGHLGGEPLPHLPDRPHLLRRQGRVPQRLQFGQRGDRGAGGPGGGRRQHRHQLIDPPNPHGRTLNAATDTPPTPKDQAGRLFSVTTTTPPAAACGNDPRFSTRTRTSTTANIKKQSTAPSRMKASP